MYGRPSSGPATNTGVPSWRTMRRPTPASRPTPGDVSRREAERLNEAGYGDASRWELLESRVRREGETKVTIVHRLRDRQSDTIVETPPYTNYE